MIVPFIQSAALGFIAGILYAKNFQWGLFLVPLLTAVGVLLLAWSIFLGISKKNIVLPCIITFFIFGIADTYYHLDTSSKSHLQTIISSESFDQGAQVTGKVNSAPDIREHYTILPLDVDRIVASDGRIFPVSRGRLYVKIYPAIGDYYSTAGYGDEIKLTGVIIRNPAKATNPGSFDMRQFLNNQGYYAIASVRRADQIELVKRTISNPAMKAALGIKKQLLISIKQTLPFPESSFLGGVLLGLRSGLSFEIKEMFRAAGVSHVLAVSGLHVTIITLFFMGLLGLLKLPKSTSFFIILAAIIFFTLLTGARPSTIRAAIMNGITLLFYYFRGMKLDRSFLLGIAAAALSLLIYNPLILTEAAFLFSFTAVLSLAILTRPLWDLACRYLRGFFPILLTLAFLTAFAVWLVSPHIFINEWPYTLIAVFAILATIFIDRRFPNLIEFRQLPRWVSVFAAAQLAIQLGMLPMTAFYFKKVSITAMMANFIAIPLIGVIVQLGLFAGILFQIPVAGPYLALTLNAANWLAVKLFLGTAQFFGTRFPYPDVSPPSTDMLVIYYILLSGFVVWPWIRWKFYPAMRILLNHRHMTAIRIRFIAIAVVGAIFGANTLILMIQKPKVLKITFFDPSMYHMGGGNSVLIETPSNFKLLIDAGPRRTMTAGKEMPLDIGDRVIAAALFSQHITSLDGVLLSSPRSEYVGGLVSIMDNPGFNIKRLYHGLPFTELPPNASRNDVLALLKDPALLDERRLDSAQLMAWDLRDIFRAAYKRDIGISPVKEGLILHKEKMPAGKGDRTELTITVLNPPQNPFDGRYSNSANSVALEVRVGKFTTLLTSNIDRKAQHRLITHYAKNITLLQVPASGSSYSLVPEFIDAFKPEIAVLSPIMSGWVQKSNSELVDLYQEKGVDVFRTDESGALSVSSDGNKMWIHEFLPDRSREMDL